MKYDHGTISAARFWVFLLGLAILLFAGYERNLAQSSASPAVPAASKANNMRYVDCNKHISGKPGLVEIAVDSAEGIPHEFEVVFVCTGELVRWAVSSAGASTVQSFRIDFQNNESPFVNNPLTLSGDGATATAQNEVKPLDANLHSKPYKYTIVVTRKDGNKITLDPVVIPMGN
ncbi:MAG: hypothetical protein LAN71_03815 [Acidobacteriia bacterium]|nr:hypothetical protein [Terriglobia bacterium]